MGHITKITTVETATTIWKYDPSLPNNHVFGKLLDMIALIHTIAIKVYDSDYYHLHYF